MLTPLLLLGGCAFLLWGAAEALVKGSATFGRRAGISPVVIGLTVVSIGTSAPELVVCILAALRGSPDLAVGNVVGSNLANIGLILGLAAILRPLPMTSQVVRREVPWMIGVTLLVIPLLWNFELGRVEGTVLASILCIYLILMVPLMRGTKSAPRTSPSPLSPPIVPRDRIGGWGRPEGLRAFATPTLLIIGGSLGLVAGGQGIVAGATGLAEVVGLPEMIVGLSVVAIGTSLPELATTLVAAFRGEADMAVGNVVGSNIFNLTFVLGGTALISPLTVHPHILIVEYAPMVVLSLALLPIAWTGRRVGRREGALLLALYAGSWAWMLQVTG